MTLQYLDLWISTPKMQIEMTSFVLGTSKPQVKPSGLHGVSLHAFKVNMKMN